MFLPPDLVGDYKEAQQSIDELLTYFEALPNDFKSYRSSDPSLDLAPALEQALNLVKLHRSLSSESATHPGRQKMIPACHTAHTKSS